jgi:glycosyltransferase involved in cell wall biosynthesis
MAEHQDKKATICVVQYKTLQLTKLCLRSIRKFTNYPYEVIVIDNNSADESLEYLKSLNWINLIERKDPVNDSSGGYAHAAALDMGLQKTNTEFFVTVHSDTIVHKDNWLSELISFFGEDANTACVGSGKIELKSAWRKRLKKANDFRTFKRKLLATPDPIGKHRYYNRTICCFYRTEILKREKLSFLMDREKGLAVGKKLYFELVDRGYKTVELPPKVMGEYIIHLAHATQVINMDEFNLRNRTIRKGRRQLKKVLASDTIQNIISDDSLDK